MLVLWAIKFSLPTCYHFPLLSSHCTASFIRNLYLNSPASRPLLAELACPKLCLSLQKFHPAPLRSMIISTMAALCFKNPDIRLQQLILPYFMHILLQDTHQQLSTLENTLSGISYITQTLPGIQSFFSFQNDSKVNLLKKLLNYIMFHLPSSSFLFIPSRPCQLSFHSTSETGNKP